MIKTYIYGISGKMGKTITECLPDDFALVGGADSRHTDKCCYRNHRTQPIANRRNPQMCNSPRRAYVWQYEHRHTSDNADVQRFKRNSRL